MAKGKKTVRAASVTVAKTAGFCFGVKRAVDQVYQLAENPAGPIYTYGPIIHNEEVVEDLRRRGVEVLPEFGSGEEFPPLTPDTTVVIRSHGVGKKVYRELEKLGVKVVDATCPFVERIHRIVEEQAKDGRQIVVAGNAAHPEVQGICDFAHGDAESENGTESRVVCIETPEEAEKLPFPEGTRVCLVAQTTFNFKKFQVMVEKISEKGYDTVVVNTICNATQERQEEAGRLAEASDLMLVVGGRNSSNTQKLFEICHGKCGRTYFIQTAQDFHAEDLQDGDNVGITAGASTPGKIIEEVNIAKRIYW